MKIIPKTTKYNLKFRNKIQTKSVFKHDLKQANPIGSIGFQRNLRAYQQLYKKAYQPHSACINNFFNGWVPMTADVGYTTATATPTNGCLIKQSAGVMPTQHRQQLDLYHGKPHPLPQPKQAKRHCFSDRSVISKPHNLSELTVGNKAFLIEPCVSYGYAFTVLFGTSAILFKTHGKLKAKCIETIHLLVAKQLKKKSKVWLRICCDTPVTARPAETRMGKGKGAINYWEAKVFPGQVFFEFNGLTETQTQTILQQVSKKSPVALKAVRR